MSTAVKLTTRSGWWEFRDVIAKGEGFKTSGALSGGPYKFYAKLGPVGILPREYEASVRGADYVIYSYATPIAWRTQGQWHTPDVKYSVTTSRHQSRIFTAIDQLLT